MKARLAFAALALVAGTAAAQQQPATGSTTGSTGGSAMGSSMQDSSSMKSTKMSSKKHSRRHHTAKKKAMMSDSASMKQPS